jgi:hypothetical protein
MVATPISTSTAPAQALAQEHYSYFLERAFHFDHINILQEWGVRSISLSEALSLGVKKYDPDTQQHLSDGGIWFPFTADYGQVRFNEPLTLAKGDRFKYLGPRKPATAWIPPCAKGWASVEAITEGWADAAAPTVRGVNTAALVGIYNLIHCVPAGCRIPIIFDSDGWTNPGVMRALLQGAIWTQGKVNLFPHMEAYPKGGGSEFFKAGYTINDYRTLIDEAMTPYQLLLKWIEHWGKMPRKTQTYSVAVAMEAREWLKNPDAVFTYLKQQRDKKNPNPDEGISPNHEDAESFLAKAIEEDDEL